MNDIVLFMMKEGSPNVNVIDFESYRIKKQKQKNKEKKDPTLVRLNVNISGAVAGVIENNIQKYDTTQEEIVHKALSMYQVIREQTAQNLALVIQPTTSEKPATNIAFTFKKEPEEATEKDNVVSLDTRRTRQRLETHLTTGAAIVIRTAMEEDNISSTEVVNRAFSILSYVEEQRGKGIAFLLVDDIEAEEPKTNAIFQTSFPEQNPRFSAQTERNQSA